MSHQAYQTRHFCCVTKEGGNKDRKVKYRIKESGQNIKQFSSLFILFKEIPELTISSDINCRYKFHIYIQLTSSDINIASALLIFRFCFQLFCLCSTSDRGSRNPVVHSAPFYFSFILFLLSRTFHDLANRQCLQKPIILVNHNNVMTPRSLATGRQ